MVSFFQTPLKKVYAVQSAAYLKSEDIKKISWLFGDALFKENERIEGHYIGAKREMVSPKSTNAVDIAHNMGITDIRRIEEFFFCTDEHPEYDPMLQEIYNELTPDLFDVRKNPESPREITDITGYNNSEGLALNEEEIHYLETLAEKLRRPLTDSEVFGFSQVNSEHCRHKIFNGEFVLNGETQEESLFQLIRKTSEKNPNRIVSAYKDNCAFIKGPMIRQFAPENHDKPDFFNITDIQSVISLKAETHNFPTTVEPFNGAATGTGGEIRDRMAGGKASIPMAGTAVYMTPYPRIDDNRPWSKAVKARKWLYQTPEQILIKASNGASDFGNKFGQPLICGSLLTFEHSENNKTFGFDKVIMLAGGVGYAKRKDSLKDKPEPGDLIIVLGGDNYRIGMGGGAVSSVSTGEFKNAVELNAVQRSNPEMQKRVANVIRAYAEMQDNPIISIHDHGAGGHLNCLSELVEDKGGIIYLNKLPVGDPTLSAKEIAGNESQERMGLVIKPEDLDLMQRIALRERAPMFVVGEVTGDMHFTFQDDKLNIKPIDIDLADMFGKPPKTILIDTAETISYQNAEYTENKIGEYLKQILQLESVGCKDWLTNKVDRSVGGKIAMQQCGGILQLPLNDCAVVALDFNGKKGIVTSIGHAPIAGLADPEKASRLSVAEALTNCIWAPIQDSLSGVSLSANWMWSAKQPGEDERLYRAVKSLSEFCIDLGINVPTGKDSLSMTQKYTDRESVYAPGTVIVSTVGETEDVRKSVGTALKNEPESRLFYIDFSSDKYQLGGSSFFQTQNRIGSEVPDVKNPEYFKSAFNAVQELVRNGKISAGHDISAGGMITALLEMTFSHNSLGLNIDLSKIDEDDAVKLLFAENPGIIFQTTSVDFIKEYLYILDIKYHIIGQISSEPQLYIHTKHRDYTFNIPELREIWYKPSLLLDRRQCAADFAETRYANYKNQPLTYDFKHFTGKASDYGIDLNRRKKTGIRAAIIREQGVNGDREMAYTLYLAGFDVKDVHMTDLISGRETLEEVNMIVFTGGFSNSDVMGSAKGWAGSFLFNPKAKQALENFYKREDTLSLGVCNGCQLMQELKLIVPEHGEHPKMKHNNSSKFESAFISVEIAANNSVMLGSMEGMRLGVWIAHGEGKFYFPNDEEQYQIPMKYAYPEYPGNPNGSDFSTAALCSTNGRHLGMMPHPERAFAPWQWAYYPENRNTDEVSPWIEAFVNAREWIIKIK